MQAGVEVRLDSLIAANGVSAGGIGTASARRGVYGCG